MTAAGPSVINLEAQILAVFELPPTGCLRFTPRLTCGMRYILEITGSCRARWYNNASFTVADAVHLYGGEHPGNDAHKPCASLWFNDARAPLPFYEDRELSLYRFAVTGTGEKLRISFSPTPAPPGMLVVTLRGATGEENAALDAPERDRRVAERVKRAAATYKRTAELEARLRDLVSEHAELPHRSDWTWLRKHAAANCKDLLADREKITRASVEFHRDEVFVAVVKGRAPEIYTRALWQIRALAFAEQIAAEPIEGTPPPPPRPRLTPDEYRARELARLDVKVKDAMAVIIKEQRTRQAAEQMLDTLDVAEEDRERYRQVVGRIFEDDGEEVPDGLAPKKL